MIYRREDSLGVMDDLWGESPKGQVHMVSVLGR